jgi:DNA-binding NarL/FixJ family response regulator
MEDEPTSEGARRSQPTTYWRYTGKPVISIAMIDEHSFTRECITRSLQGLGDDLNIVSFATCEDCLNSARNYDLVLYHAHESLADREYNHDNFSAAAKVLPIAPLIILSVIDTPESIVKAFERGARGYVPIATTTPELAVEIIRLVKAGGTFVPPSSLSLQRSSRQGITPRVITNPQFTPRQLAVLDRLKLGESNKAIAHELEMSESTVKVHIRNIMRKLKVTNRTEAACIALMPWRRPEV